MASIRSHLIKLLLRLFNPFTNADLDVIKLRNRINKLCEWIPVHHSITVTPIDLGKITAEWLTPRGAANDRALLYLHGGAWMIGSSAMVRPLSSQLARLCRTRVLSINYRLAPEHPFPAGLEDCVTAFTWLLAQGIHPGKTAVAGDSAGGNLALALLLALRDRGMPLPCAAVALSPPTDLTGSGLSHQTRTDKDPLFGKVDFHHFVRMYMGSYDPRHPLISPLFADLHDLPPLLLCAGDHEVLRDDSIRFAAKARECGVDATLSVWPHMFHVFQFCSPFLPEARQSFGDIMVFLRKRLTGG